MSHFSGHFEGASTFFKKVLAPSKCPSKWLIKWLSRQKKIISRSFLNSGTLIVIMLLFAEGCDIRFTVKQLTPPPPPKWLFSLPLSVPPGRGSVGDNGKFMCMVRYRGEIVCWKLKVKIMKSGFKLGKGLKRPGFEVRRERWVCGQYALFSTQRAAWSMFRDTVRGRAISALKVHIKFHDQEFIFFLLLFLLIWSSGVEIEKPLGEKGHRYTLDWNLKS